MGLVAQSVGLPVLARKTHKYLLASPPWAQVSDDQDYGHHHSYPHRSSMSLLVHIYPSC